MVSSLSRRVLERQDRALSLVNVTVCAVRHTGLGHRVCVDTTSVMSTEEGMIVGSTGWGGIFVCSETHYLPHMNLREFRVNAGAVHSYIRNVLPSGVDGGQELFSGATPPGGRWSRALRLWVIRFTGGGGVLELRFAGFTGNYRFYAFTLDGK